MCYYIIPKLYYKKKKSSMGKYYILVRTFSGKLVNSKVKDIFETSSIIISNTG